MEYHELANIFPLMEGSEFKQLCDDIASEGLHVPIITYQGKIIDGRNRYRACQQVGVIPDYQEWDGKGDLLRLILSMNLKRRHLNTSQRALIATELANMQRGNQPNVSIDTFKSVSQPEAAELLNVSRLSVIRARKVLDTATPEIIEQVKAGDMTVNKAIQETKRSKVISNLNDLKVQETKAVAGVYDVIVIDPPWPMVKIERDVRPNQMEFDYPTMTLEEIKNLTIQTADDCHIWLWTTHKFLPDAFDVLRTWGMKYVCTFVWHKPGGFQPVGLPQYNSEFCLYARKGTPIFIDTKDFMVCFNASRGMHSEKPDAFYDVIRRVTSGRRLDMFARRSIDGFESWGNEA